MDDELCDEDANAAMDDVDGGYDEPSGAQPWAAWGGGGGGWWGGGGSSWHDGALGGALRGRRAAS